MQIRSDIQGVVYSIIARPRDQISYNHLLTDSSWFASKIRFLKARREN
jgi:hypothetical protein